jgi:serine phosphatase RsbU (regulator of sigma subunit)
MRRREALRLHARDHAAATLAEARASDDGGYQIGPVGLPDAMILLPLAVIAAVTVADLSTSSGVRFDPMLAAGPALAAAICGVLGTVLIALLAVGAHGALAAYHGSLSTTGSSVDFLALVGVALAGVLAAYVRQRRERQLARARSVAEAAQRALLRPMPQEVGVLRVAAAYLAAQAEARIGGDLYDAAHTRYGDRLLVGDVRGKGLAAVDSAAALLGVFREAAYQAADLPDLLRRLDASVRRQALRSSAGDVFAERFVTGVVVEVDRDRPVARVVCCGHPSPVLLRRRSAQEIDPGDVAPPLGLGVLGDIRYQPVEFGYLPGDVLLLFTDGVTEARDRSGRFFPLLERAGAHAGAEPAELVNRLITDLLDHAGGRLTDDAAMVAIGRPPSGPTPAGSSRLASL